MVRHRDRGSGEHHEALRAARQRCIDRRVANRALGAADELARIKRLVQSAIGFDAKRGDTVEVVSMRFAAGEAEAAAPAAGLLGLDVSKADLVGIAQSAILAIVVLGGMGSQLGVVFAATVLVVLPELGRDFSEYRMLLFGIAMVLIMIVRPGGLIRHRRATVSAPVSAPGVEVKA